MDNNLWGYIRERLQTALPPHVISSFVEPVTYEGVDGNFLKLAFPSKFCLENFSTKCAGLVGTVLEELNLAHLKPQLVLAEGPTQLRLDLEPPPVLMTRSPFDGKHTFDSFVVGASNQFAHAACGAVAQQPGQCYNPLFIFGGAGLGKTHLLKAIGHEIHKKNQFAKILFLTSESFTNELIQAIRTDKMREFREKYRNSCDVLLIDDVHFLAGKERTQEEFFYTFNFLHEARRQIVISSDRYPRDIEGLENRLRTRFEWGLVADVQPPDLETRVAILKNKAEQSGIFVPDEVAQYIGSHITANIRELEGSLHRLQAYSSLNGTPISLDLAARMLKDITPNAKHDITADGIMKLVALQFNVKTADLKSDKRVRKLTVPRQVCMYLLRKYLLLSYPEIGRFLGGKDHTTVLHGVSRMADLMKKDAEVLNQVTTIESLIR